MNLSKLAVDCFITGMMQNGICEKVLPQSRNFFPLSPNLAAAAAGIIFEIIGKKHMKNNFLANFYARELEAEYNATHKCLERIPEKLYGFKPHPKSMELGYLALLVAEIPRWIVHTIKDGVIDFATYKNFELSTSDALLKHYEENFKNAVKTLDNVSDDKLEDKFTLKNKDQLLMSSTKKETVGSSINHWVHHRGQLTVYMRLNEIAVPSIYGPSADEKTFG